MSHTSTVPGDRGSFDKDDSNRQQHENHLGRDYHETKRISTTDSDWSASSFPELLNAQEIDQLLARTVEPPLEFRKVQTGPRKPRPSKSRPAPVPLPQNRAWQSMEEDWEAVAVDEELDGAKQVEHHDPKERDEPPQSQEGNVDPKRRVPRLLLSHRDKNQLEILRLSSKKKKTNFATASADFISWKRLLKEVSNPESKSPSSIELRMLHDVLALDSADSMTTFLSYSSPDHKRNARNRFLLCTTLRHAPEKGALVLQALLSASPLPFYMFVDSLAFLAYRLRQMETVMKQDCAQKLADLVVQAAKLGKKSYRRPTQNTIFSILAALPPTRLEDWFHQLMAHKVPLHKYTLLQFASRFAKMSATKDLSIDIWRDLCETGSLEINSPIGASLCTSLLAFKDDDLHALDENVTTPAELFESLLNMGLIPNVITYTTIIHSLCVKKDLQTAMEVFDVMEQHGVRPDSFTYSVMMNGYKSCGDFGTMLRFASNARAAGAQDPIVWNDLIHATFLACLREPRVPGGIRRARCVVWGPMNAIFARFFNPQTLRTLITVQLNEVREFMQKQGFVPSKMQGAFHEIPKLHPGELLQPTSSTLSLMALGFVRHLPRPNDVILFYDQFKKLLREGDPVAQSIVQEQGSMVHDIVLRALIKFKGTLRVMLSIIRDMMTDIGPPAAVTSTSSLQTFKPQINDSPPNSATNIEDPAVDSSTTNPKADTTTAAADVTEAEGEAANRDHPTVATALSNAGNYSGEARPPIRHPRPSIYTWSILLKGFMTNNLPQEAEHILKLMKIHGVEPTIVTWNTLAAGYAKLGDTYQAVEAMRRLEGAGFKSDDYTMRAFSYIRDKIKAIRLMEQKVEENKLTKAAMEEGLEQQHEDEADFDETAWQESEVEDDGLSAHYEQEPRMAQEASQWPPNENTPSTGTQTQPEAQGPGRPAEERRPASGQASQAPPHEETEKPVVKVPRVSRRELGAWDDFLWDHAASPEGQDKREESGF